MSQKAISQQQYSLDYSQLIQEYKKEYFKKMPILNHEFIYSSFHPSLDDCLIALEKNYYPYESELFGLVQSPDSFYQKIIKNLEGLKNPDKIKKFAEMIGIGAQLLTEISEEELDLDTIRLSPKTKSETPKTKTDKEASKNSPSRVKEQPSVPSINSLAQKLKESLLKQIENDKMHQEEDTHTKRMSTFIRNQVLKGQQTSLIKKQTMYLTDELLKRQKAYQSEITIEENKQINTTLGQQQLPVPIHTTAQDDQKEKFRFFEPKALVEHKLMSSNKMKYAISIWKINRGSQSFQLKEYAFNLKPIGNKFYVSHCGKQVLLYLGCDKRDQNGELVTDLETIKILNSETLEFIKEINAKVELNLNNQQIFDSALLWNCSYLYIQCFDISYFIDLQHSEITNEYYLLNDQVEQTSRLKITTYTNKKFQHALFKEDEPRVLYGVVEIHKQRVAETGTVVSENQIFELIRLSLNQPDLFHAINLYKSINKSKLEYNGTIAYNKQLTQIVFPGEQVVYVFSIPNTPLSPQSVIQPIRNVQNCQVNKHSFLYEHIWITYNDESYDTFTTSTEDFSKKFPLSDFDLDNYSLGDTVKEAKQEDQEQNVLSLGRNNSKGSSVSSRFCINSSKYDEPPSAPETVSYVNELSEFICNYPFLIFCKGNSELFIQSLHSPTSLIKMDLQDQFLSFVEINYNMEHKPEHIALGMKDGSQLFRNYETIVYLSQKDDKIHLNLIEYKLPFGGGEMCKDPDNHIHQLKEKPLLFEEDKESDTSSKLRRPVYKKAMDDSHDKIVKTTSDEQYLFYRSAVTIAKPPMSYGSIIKAVLSKVKHKECKDHDYIVILQYRNTILIRSFYNLYHLNIDKCKFLILMINFLVIFKFPFIFLPAKKTHKSDMSFFVAKDGYSTKIERICFNGKDMKDSPVSTVYELKTSNVFIFNYHNGCFYLMDDSLTLKKFQYDRRTQKLKPIKVYEFALEYRDLLSSLSNEFNDVQVTERGIYKGVLFIPFYDASIYNKDYSLIKVEPVLNIKNLEDLFEGPKKLAGTQYMMYIARENTDVNAKDQYSDSSENSENEDEDEHGHQKSNNESEASIDEDSHNIPPRSPSKIDFHKSANVQGGPPPLDSDGGSKIIMLKRAPTVIPTHKKNSHSDDLIQKKMLDPLKYSFSMKGLEDKKVTKKIKITQNDNESSFKSKYQQPNPSGGHGLKNIIRQMTMPTNKKTFIEDEINEYYNQEQVYAWIVPYLDSNVIHLTHNRKENSNPQYEISFSSFLNTHDEIICAINNVYYIFSKNGRFLYGVDIVKENGGEQFYFLKNNLQLQHVSPNLQYFLFYNSTHQKFEVFKLVAQSNTKGNKLQNVFKTRRKGRMLSGAQSFLQLKSENQSVKYRFEYVKDVKEVSSGYNQEDYFHQRIVSNQGLVFQLIIQEKIPNLMGEEEKVEELPKNKKKKPKKSILKKVKSIAQPLSQKKTIFKEFSQQEDEITVNVFHFYIDNESVQGIKPRFLLIQQHLDSSEDPSNEFLNFGYAVLGQQLFIRRGNQLEFMEVFDLDFLAKAIEKPVEVGALPFSYQSIVLTGNPSQKATLLNLKFDKGVQVMRLMETVRDDLVQIIACDNRFMFVITWDIVHNNEHAMIQIENKFNFQAAHMVCKGMSEKLNYIPINNGLYDLNYSLPFMIFQDLKISSNRTASMQINERKLSRFNKEYLDIFDNNKVYLSYTYLDLCYMKGLKALNEDSIDLPQIMMQHLNFRVKGATIFHEFALNYHLLQHLYEEICKVDEAALIGNMTSDREQDIMHLKKLIFLNLLYPNFYNNTAFDVAMQKKSPKSIEIMLQMLSTLPLFSISKWILPHFQELLTMQLKSFNDFMSTCQFQQPKMREVRMIKWPYKEDDHFIAFHTSYLGSYFHNMLQKVDDPFGMDEDDDLEEGADATQQLQLLKSEDFTMFELVDGIENNSNLKGKNLKIYEKAKKKREKKEKAQQADINKSISFDQIASQQMKRIELNAVEFDWVFKGQMAIDFIAHLAEQENDQLFRNSTIRIIILFLWGKFFYNIRNKIFYPFIMYFLCYITLTTIIYEKKILIRDYIDGVYANSTTEPTYANFTPALLYKYEQANIAFLVFSTIGWFYFLWIEIFQMTFFRLSYFTQFWNYIDLASLGVNLAFFIANIIDVPHSSGRVLASISIFFIYIKAFYFFRLFQQTAAFMRMIMQICLDIRVFVLIWFFAIIAFSNGVFIMSQNLDYDTMYSLIQDSYLQTFIYNYELETGSFQISTYNSGADQQLWWIVFMAQTIIIQIIFLNLLIAIMSDTFDRVQSNVVESKLREICQLISEYEYVVNRDQMFKTSKYIIVASVEKAQTNDADDWNGKINTLRNVFQTQIQDLKRDSKQTVETFREELISNSKNIDQKFMDLQSFVMKQNSQSALMLKKIDQLTEKVAHSVKQNEKMMEQHNKGGADILEHYKDLDTLQMVGQSSLLKNPYPLQK